MAKFKGGLLSPTQTVLSGTNYTGKANGVFKLAEQIQAKQSSLWAKGLTLPLAPTIGTATFGNTNASVAFTAPSDTGGTSILDYTVTSTPGNFTVTGASSPLTVTGLTNGTNYTFTVRARNSQGNSPESAASNSTGITIPGVPTIGTAVYGDTLATVNFTAPASNGGSAILDYTVTSTPGNFTATGTGTSIVVTGLTNGTSYTFKVKARNIVGSSAESAASNSIIPSGYTVPDAPTIGTVVQPSFTGTSADFTFSIPFTAPANTGGQPILDYTVTSSLGTTVTGTSSPISFTGVTPATSNITFTVKARNSMGSSVASAVSAAVKTPPSIGQAWKGGYFGGRMTDASIVYDLIVAPKASGQSDPTGIGGSVNRVYGPDSAAPVAARSMTNGPAASASMNSATYPAAQWCESLSIGGYTDWYMPSRDEMIELTDNLLWAFAVTADTSLRASSGGYGADGLKMGSCASAVPPRTTGWDRSGISSLPSIFKFVSAGGTGTESFSRKSDNSTNITGYLTSSEWDTTKAWNQRFYEGLQDYANTKSTAGNYFSVRAMRREVA